MTFLWETVELKYNLSHFVLILLRFKDVNVKMSIICFEITCNVVISLIMVCDP